MSDIAVKFIPIFLIIGIGVVFRRKGVLTEASVAGMKNLIINLGLPAIFFVSFLTMELKQQYLYLFIITFLFCLLLFYAGMLLEKLKITKIVLSRFFFTGFEFGMVGVALFSSLFGSENLQYILLFGLGHEFFIWFVYAPLLSAQNEGRVELKKTVRSFLTSPIILAIISALFLNITGIYHTIEDFSLMEGFISACRIAGNLTTPLILLAIGFQMKFSGIEWSESIRMILLRFAVVIIAGIGLFLILDTWVIEFDSIMIYALITFILLPPPYIIPIFLGEKFRENSSFYSSLLILATLATLIIYALAIVIAGTLLHL